MVTCFTTSADCRVIVDTSALVAILREETDAAVFGASIHAAERTRISAGTLLETAIVIDGNRNARLSRRLDNLIQRIGIVTEPVTEEQAHIARRAYQDYGKGSAHPARLNFGDCFAYALARVTGEPLLFKGDHFAHTDITPALREPK
jgi:ribonuclease VapC